MDLRNVEVAIQLLGNIYLVTDIILSDMDCPQLLGLHPRFSMCLLDYISLLQEFRSQGVGFGLRLFAGSPE